MNTHAVSKLRAAALILLMGLTLAACSKDDSPTNPGDNNNNNTVADTVRPVVFVHGYLSASDAWTPAIQFFRLNGYPRNYLHTVDFTNYLATGAPNLDAMATQLDVVVSGLIQQTGFKRIDVIAHSMGVSAVQYYITKKGGVDKVAHFVGCAGVVDNSLTLNGTLTPSPVKYRTIRSDGYDATQGGDPSKGSMTGADNTTVGGMDHEQIISHVNAVRQMYAFCTGKDMSKVTLPVSTKASIGGKVITFVDNAPVTGAIVTIYNVSPTDGRTYTPFLYQGTTDAEGKWGPIEITRGYNILIDVEATDYHRMHYYRLSYRDSSFTERLRIVPKTGGTPLLQAFRGALQFGTEHSMVVVFSPYRAMYDGRDSVSVAGVRVTNAQTSPIPGAGATGSNTVSLFCFDDKSDKRTTSGPMSNPLLNTFAINSFDLYVPAVPAGQALPVIMNNQKLFFRNWRSQMLPPYEDNQGISVVQFDYF